MSDSLYIQTQRVMTLIINPKDNRANVNFKIQIKAAKSINNAQLTFLDWIDGHTETEKKSWQLALDAQKEALEIQFAIYKRIQKYKTSKHTETNHVSI